MNLSKTKRSSQTMDNFSFDEEYLENTVLVVGEHENTLVRLKLGADGSIALATEDPLTPYKITDKDDDASPNYFGFTKKDGSWYIMKETVSAGADTYRYVAGTEDYTTNWTNRASLSYDYFYATF
jgi:hypothetical protein